VANKTKQNKTKQIKKKLYGVPFLVGTLFGLFSTNIDRHQPANKKAMESDNKNK
jgi:hypothetical protein